MNEAKHGSLDNSVPSRVPLLLSAFVCPGAGQLCQRRWLPVFFFAGAFRRQRRITAENRLGRKLEMFSAVCLALLVYSQLAGSARASGLHRAVLSNDMSKVSAILDKDPVEAVNSTIGQGITPLHLAAAMDNEELASLLISRGADKDARTTSGFAPLHWAAGKNAAGTARLLISIGADINARAGNDITPLHWAATQNATEVTELLISAGADIHARTSSSLTPLHWAVKTEANDAAAVIAFTAVSQEEESNASPDMHVDPEPGEPSDNEEPNPETLPTALPRSAFGKHPVVPIGPDTELAFVWIEPLQIWMGKYEVTNGQYRQHQTDHKSLFYEGFTLGRASQPVVYVSWNDASDFCAWLNKTFRDRIPANCEFRLPTEKEWITVARCGDDRIYPWGNRMPPKFGNYSDKAAKRELSEWSGIVNYDDGYPVTSPVSDSGENEWGIFGLGGNVWEWCEDWYDSSEKYKTRHGGSWYFDREECLRIDCRGFDRPDARYDTIGFRLVLSLTAP